MDKYGKIVAERKEFHEDEPIFVLRGQDLLAPRAVEAYANLVRAAAIGEAADGTHETDDLERLAAECDNIAMLLWQSSNTAKLPD
jgi:hypothetical protein